MHSTGILCQISLPVIVRSTTSLIKGDVISLSLAPDPAVDIARVIEAPGDSSSFKLSFHRS